jgi:hypothetical protein
VLLDRYEMSLVDAGQAQLLGPADQSPKPAMCCALRTRTLLGRSGSTRPSRRASSFPSASVRLPAAVSLRPSSSHSTRARNRRTVGAAAAAAWSWGAGASSTGANRAGRARGAVPRPVVIVVHVRILGRRLPLAGHHWGIAGPGLDHAGPEELDPEVPLVHVVEQEAELSLGRRVANPQAIGAALVPANGWVGQACVLAGPIPIQARDGRGRSRQGCGQPRRGTGQGSEGGSRRPSFTPCRSAQVRRSSASRRERSARRRSSVALRRSSMRRRPSRVSSSTWSDR